MHKRSEAEIKMLQEVKNNSDFIYHTNVTLQSLSNAIVNLSLQYEKLRGDSQSQLKELEIAFENHAEFVLQEIHQCTQLLSQFRQDLTTKSKEFKDFVDGICQEYEKKGPIFDAIEKIIKTQVSLRDDLHILEDYTRKQMEKLGRQLDERDKQLRHDLTPPPKDPKELESAIAVQLKPFQVNFDGYLKELSICKKAIAYGEKKFEAIFTLIERIKRNEA